MCIADICLCYSVNTAGIAGLAGKRAVYWDPNFTIAPLRFLKVDKNIIFSDFDTIKNKLINLLEKSSLGDHKKWLDTIDPFRDGRGPERAGQIIHFCK